MSLGLSHSLSRYKLKFSPDKVSTIPSSLATTLSSTVSMYLDRCGPPVAMCCGLSTVLHRYF